QAPLNHITGDGNRRCPVCLQGDLTWRLFENDRCPVCRTGGLIDQQTLRCPVCRIGSLRKEGPDLLASTAVSMGLLRLPGAIPSVQGRPGQADRVLPRPLRSGPACKAGDDYRGGMAANCWPSATVLGMQWMCRAP